MRLRIKRRRRSAKVSAQSGAHCEADTGAAAQSRTLMSAMGPLFVHLFADDADVGMAHAESFGAAQQSAQQSENAQPVSSQQRRLAVTHPSG